MRRLLLECRWLLVVVGCLLLMPALAVAAVPGHVVLPSPQLWTLAIGAVVPLVTYVINHVGPWVTEPVKAFVLVIASAAAAALYGALATNVIGFNTPTLQLLLTGVIGALGAHHLLWKPSGVSTVLGGGSNRARVPVAPTAKDPVGA